MVKSKAFDPTTLTAIPQLQWKIMLYAQKVSLFDTSLNYFWNGAFEVKQRYCMYVEYNEYIRN